MNENRQLAVFRVKVGTRLEEYADRMKIFVAENAALGMKPEGIKAIRENPLSRWAWERERLIKDVKREVAGLINRVHIAAYLRDKK